MRIPRSVAKLLAVTARQLLGLPSLRVDRRSVKEPIVVYRVVASLDQKVKIGIGGLRETRRFLRQKWSVFSGKIQKFSLASPTCGCISCWPSISMRCRTEPAKGKPLRQRSKESNGLGLVDSHSHKAGIKLCGSLWLALKPATRSKITPRRGPMNGSPRGS